MPHPRLAAASWGQRPSIPPPCHRSRKPCPAAIHALYRTPVSRPRVGRRADECLQSASKTPDDGGAFFHFLLNDFFLEPRQGHRRSNPGRRRSWDTMGIGRMRVGHSAHACEKVSMHDHGLDIRPTVRSPSVTGDSKGMDLTIALRAGYGYCRRDAIILRHPNGARRERFATQPLWAEPSKRRVAGTSASSHIDITCRTFFEAHLRWHAHTVVYRAVVFLLATLAC